jgi:hypothetical protein
MKLKEPRKLSHQESPVTQLKLLWRKGITEGDKDYWREQFESGRARKEIRQELLEFYQIELKQDVQLARFCQWVEEEDLRKSAYEDVLSDRAELEAQGVGEKDMDLKLIRRMKERALARGDFKLGAMAIKLSVDMQKMAFQSKRTELQGERVKVAQQRVEIARQRLALQERKVVAVEKEKEHEKKMESQPGGLTRDVLEKIEEELKLFPPYVIKDGKKVFINNSIPGVTDTLEGNEDEDEDEDENEPATKDEPRETAEEFQQRKDEEEWVQWKKEKHFE